MTEIELLRNICWVSLAFSSVAIITTVIPMSLANGSRPILLAQTAMAIMMFIGAVFLLQITYSIDQINSTGFAEVGVFYLRIKPIIVSCVLIWVGSRYWRNRHDH